MRPLTEKEFFMQDLLEAPVAAPTTSLEQMAKALEDSLQYRVLRRFDAEILFRPDRVPVSADVGIATVLDTETTGKDSSVDLIVELGMVTFAYDRITGRVLSALDRFNELEDPGMPIPEAASRVNGITDDMVKGKRINDEAVQLTVEMSDFIIAHNSRFDREVCERRFPFMKGKPWACSLSQVDWESSGMASAKLEFIAFRMGFYYEAHRADADCLALLHALDQPLVDGDGRTPLAHVLSNFQTEARRIWAVGASYDVKDALKDRGYRWSDGTKPNSEKAWWIEVSLEQFEDEMAWLRANAFGNRSFSVPVDRIDAFSRFTSRRDRLERTYR
jgi:DNA polymerase III subunit epsilon